MYFCLQCEAHATVAPRLFYKYNIEGAAGAGWDAPSMDGQGKHGTGAAMGVRITMHHARYV